MEELIISGQTKKEQYETLLPQIASVIEDEPDMIANMANVAAMLHETFRFWWTGFYRVIGDKLVLGPFQGPLACTRIALGRGVCGTAWKEKRTLVVQDVLQFPGHIACSSASRSEIVVPMIVNDQVIGVLDIDSEHLATFDDVDVFYLEKVINNLTKMLIKKDN
ncbi:MAG: GAF domain-containing protein [Bacteroidales bacterium]|nr:GAF domain-containing protein [Bacteroidales bacterium]